MPPLLRRLALTLHVVCSVGWLGAVGSFLALALVGLASQDVPVVRAAYVGMDLMTTLVIVPLSLAATATGIAQSLGTPWGLFRHYWVLAKLVITIPSTALLLTHTRAIHYMAVAVAEFPIAPGDLHELRVQLAVTAGAAIAALLITTGLSVLKPRGLTPYGWRKQREGRPVLPDLDGVA
ncbi:MAG: hypothetical protein RLZZ387_2993 [Chloroflexota bacterium]|jgi:hypothetical protein